MECSHLGRISSLRESELAQRFELRFLSYVAKRGLPQYVRRVHICLPRKFTPDNLLPQLHHFRSLDRVRTLTIEQFDLLRRVTGEPSPNLFRPLLPHPNFTRAQPSPRVPSTPTIRSAAPTSRKLVRRVVGNYEPTAPTGFHRHNPPSSAFMWIPPACRSQHDAPVGRILCL